MVAVMKLYLQTMASATTCSLARSQALRYDRTIKSVDRYLTNVVGTHGDVSCGSHEGTNRGLVKVEHRS